MSAVVGDIVIPGDKSISHRAIILSSLFLRTTIIENILLSDDVLATIHIMRALGVEIILNEQEFRGTRNSPCAMGVSQGGEPRFSPLSASANLLRAQHPSQEGVRTKCETPDEHKKTARVVGVGLYGLTAPEKPLHCGNSGTTMRLLCGLLSAQKFNSVLVGDTSLTRRPMLRVADPLRLMGAKINLSENNTAPIEIIGNQKLKAVHHALSLPSAQVKSAILLAGLYAQGETVITEKVKTRDHTEKMLACFRSHAHSCSHFNIPGDMSSAAFFIVAACITPHSDLIIRQVGINPLRIGVIAILNLMGANIEIFNEGYFGYEPVADIRVRYSQLKGITIPETFIVSAIDEFPAIFIAAVTAKGNTLLRNAKELRVKESDRIHVMCEGLKNLGVKTEEYDDGVLIYGDQIFQGGRVDAHHDHRVAMSFAVAGNIACDSVIVDNGTLIKTSFPDFIECANQLGIKTCLSFPSLRSTDLPVPEKVPSRNYWQKS